MSVTEPVRRCGVTLTKWQGWRVRRLLRKGRYAKAQRIILRKLEAEFGA